MVKVMEDFRAGSLGFTKKDFLASQIVKQIGEPPLRIDIIGEIDGVQYDNATSNKRYFRSGNLRIPFIGAEDFIANKEGCWKKKGFKGCKKKSGKN